MSREPDIAGIDSRRARARRTALALGITALGLYLLFILKGVLGS